MSLILLALSGMAMFHPSLFFLTNLFGGGQMTRAIHPWIGVVLFFSFLGLFFRFFALNLWNRDDTVWMKNLGAVINDREEGMPEAGPLPGQPDLFAAWHRRDRASHVRPE